MHGMAETETTDNVSSKRIYSDTTIWPEIIFKYRTAKITISKPQIQKNGPKSVSLFGGGTGIRTLGRL